MATEERKRRIRDHLLQSSGGMSFLSPKQRRPKPTTPEPPPPTPTPEPTLPPPAPKAAASKQQVLAHLNLSSSGFGNLTLEDKGKKEKILAHIRKSVS